MLPNITLRSLWGDESLGIVQRGEWGPLKPSVPKLRVCGTRRPNGAHQFLVDSFKNNTVSNALKSYVYLWH